MAKSHIVTSSTKRAACTWTYKDNEKVSNESDIDNEKFAENS